LIRLAALLLLLLAVEAPFTAQAQSPDYGSGNYMAAPCKMVADQAVEKDASNVTTYRAGLCMGKVASLRYVLNFLEDPYRSCPPKTATVGQHIKVVSAFLEQNPSRLHEEFDKLALEAMRQAWPCPKTPAR
jgi:hypothetical protein